MPGSALQLQQQRHKRRGGKNAEEFQRAWLATSALAVVESCGVGKLTVQRIIERGHISRKTFYELYPGTEACLLAGIEQTLTATRRVLSRAYGPKSGWREGMRAATAALLDGIEQRRGQARVCIVETLAAGPLILARRAQAVSCAGAAIGRGAKVAGAHQAPPDAAYAIAGGIGELLHARLLQDDPRPFTELHGVVMSMIVMPYLGHTAAREELSICGAGWTPEPAHARRKTAAPASLNIRLTYRTVRVLQAIAEHPGASNREVADHAGIADEAQISKLLRRLMDTGLVENVGDGRTRGGKNEWLLTERGGEIERASSQLGGSAA